MINKLETWAGQVRHHPWLRDARWLWDLVRPLYDAAMRRIARKGIPKRINGTDPMLLDPSLRGYPEKYEPDVWHEIMREIRVGDTFVDVGAFIGIYALAAGRRTGAAGHVFAFEPDERNYELLRQNVQLNAADRAVRVEKMAVAERTGTASFLMGKGMESRLSEMDSGGKTVDLTTLDQYFKRRRVDLLKIDVEGYEHLVLAGGIQLLSDPERRPRTIFIEMHPFAWPSTGATSYGIIAFLHKCGYEVFDLKGSPMREIRDYGEVIARPYAQAAV